MTAIDIPPGTPITRAEHTNLHHVEPLTLRDTFAAAALTGLLTPDYHDMRGTCELAYRFADAMLTARNLTKETQP